MRREPLRQQSRMRLRRQYGQATNGWRLLSSPAPQPPQQHCLQTAAAGQTTAEHQRRINGRWRRSSQCPKQL